MKWYRKTALVLLVSAACAALAADVETPPFFDALKEDGAWFKLGGTSWAWQPAVMQQDPGWRPYLDGGSWTRHEANWFWVSEYAWGAIAFHHGRWIETEAYGWLWVPGTQWCPAWVDWRLTSTHSGWAPLPPDDAFLGSIGVTNYALGWQQYAFVPNGDFLARELRDHLVDATGFAHGAVMSFAGPEPHQVGYVAPEGLGSAATVIVQEREVLPVYDEICSTVYLREPVLAYSPCQVYLDFGDGFYARHPPACRPPVRVRRPDRGRHSGPPPPASPVAQTAPSRPRPPDAIVAPPPRPPSAVVQHPPRPPSAVIQHPPRPPSAVVQHPPRPPEVAVQHPPRPPEVAVQRPPRPPSDETVTSSTSDRQSPRSSSRHSPPTAVAPTRGQVPPTRVAQGGVSANPPRGETANCTAESPGAASPFRQTRARKR